MRSACQSRQLNTDLYKSFFTKNLRAIFLLFSNAKEQICAFPRKRIPQKCAVRPLECTVRPLECTIRPFVKKRLAKTCIFAPVK